MWGTVFVSFAIALLSGAIALWNARKTNKNSLEVQKLKGAVDRELESLRARLAHRQMVSSSQWNAEFNSYQAIWRGMVAVRTLASKIVAREGELLELGLPADYLTSPDRVQIRADFIRRFTEEAGTLLLAIHENAPFYPASIRGAANETHGTAKKLIDKHLKALTLLKNRGVDLTKDEQFRTECMTILLLTVEGVDLVESLIRDRLAAVEVKDQ